MRSFAFIAALSFAAMAPMVAGCSDQEEVAGTGAISLPLSKTTADGTVYELTNATFRITGPGGTQERSSDGLNSLDVSLPAGITTIELLDGWSIQKWAPGASLPETVSAFLGTPNPYTLRVLANVSSSVDFGFIARSTNGNVSINFGVTTDPRQLAGGVRISEATGAYEPYLATGLARRADFAFYFKLNSFTSETLADGTKQHVYYAGPDELTSTPVGADFLNDAVGLLAGTVGPSMAGGYLQYIIAAKPDGTVTLSGSFSGGHEPFTTIDFGPFTLRSVIPLDANGFPTDIFFHDDAVPFKLVTSFPEGDSTMNGFLNLRHLPRLETK